MIKKKIFKMNFKIILWFCLLFFYCLYLYLNFITLNIYSVIDKTYIIILLFFFFLFFLLFFFNFKFFFFFKNFFLIFIITIFLVELLFSLILIRYTPIKPIPVYNIIKAYKPPVEYLENNPYFKFSPNKIISSQFERGKDFEYSWISDELGYKNYPGVKKNNNFYLLALGDSFTEGMGVKIEDTWPFLLEKKSQKKIFNAGVQGYAPSQFKGTLDILKNEINFEGIIIGHLSDIFEREKNFITRPLKATGGIEWIRVSRDNNVVVVQIIKKISDSFKVFYTENKKYNNEYVSLNYETNLKIKNEKLIKKYISEIKKKTSIEQLLLKDNNWKITVNSYRLIADWCNKNNKKLFLVFLPPRYTVYFNIKNSQFDIEKNIITDELKNFNIIIIDTLDVLKNFTKSASIENLPYLMFDGHLSKYGNKVIANEISNYLKKY